MVVSYCVLKVYDAGVCAYPSLAVKVSCHLSVDERGISRFAPRLYQRTVQSEILCRVSVIKPGER